MKPETKALLWLYVQFFLWAWTAFGVAWLWRCTNSPRLVWLVETASSSALAPR